MPDRHRTCPLAVTTLLLAAPVQGQDTDSIRATATACEVVRSLRQEPAISYGCRIEGFEETATEFVLRIREVPPPGVRPPTFAQSTVRLRKRDRSATVIRVPEL